MSPVQQILALKRASVQTRMDALSVKIGTLDRKIAELKAQGDGLGIGEAGAGFQFAAMAGDTARNLILTLETELASLEKHRQTLAREKLSLDISGRKLAEEAFKQLRLERSRAADRV